MRRFQKIILGFNILWVALTLLSYLAPFINPQKVWQFNFLGLAYPSLLIGNLGFIGLWFFSRKKLMLLSLTIILLGWGPLNRFFGLNLNSGNSSTETLSVMTYNMNNLKGTIEKPLKQKDIIPKVKEYLTNKNVEVIALQEISLATVKNIQSENTHPYRFGIENNKSYILSKFPLGEKGGKKFTNSGNSIIWADIKATFGTFRLVSVHLQSNQVSQQTDMVIGEFQEEFNWKNIRPILGTVKTRTNQRVDQAQEVKSLVLESPFPVVLCGDFNETPQSYIYHLLKGEMKDAFTSAGFGLGSTYAGKIPGLKIDHVFYNNSFDAIDCQIEKVSYSDHYPIIADLTYTP